MKGVFIRGMKLPESCFMCPLKVADRSNPILAMYSCRILPDERYYSLTAIKQGRRDGCLMEEKEVEDE